MKIYDYNGRKNLCGSRVREARTRLQMTQGDLAVQLQLAGIVIEGMQGVSCELKQDGGKLYLSVAAMRSAGSVVWSGAQSNVWDLFATENFLLDGQAETFVTGDRVVFDETATNKSVTLNEEVVPSAVVVMGSANYTISGTGNIGGDAEFYKEGEGTLTVNNVNNYTCILSLLSLPPLLPTPPL